MTQKTHSGTFRAGVLWSNAVGSPDAGGAIGSSVARDEEPGSEADPDTCEECRGRVVSVSNERRCESCGLVVEERSVDRGPEWRAFTAAERADRRRVGGTVTPTRHDRGLIVGVGRGDYDANGRRLATSKRRQLARLRRRQREANAVGSRERTIRAGVTEVRRLCEGLSLPRYVHERAAALFHRATKAKIVADYSIEGVATALVYLVSRDGTRARPPVRRLAEFETYARVERARWYGLTEILEAGLDVQRQPLEPHHFLVRVAGDLDAPPLLEQRARELLGDLDGASVSGRDPIYVVAAAFYAAAADENGGGDLTQVAIAETLGLNNTTISTVYTGLFADLDLAD